MLPLDTENNLCEQGYRFIAGVDEVGRGPLAGPVVAACVVFDFSQPLDEEELSLVKDSKLLSAIQRQKLFGIIKERAAGVGLASVSSQKIDKINILQASLLAMYQSVNKATLKPDFVLVDGKFTIPKLNHPQTAIIDGDALVFCIAAASIIAKVSRDWLMTEYEKKYPGYGLAQHKGYGTKLHLERLRALGPSPIHRLSFKPVAELIK